MNTDERVKFNPRILAVASLALSIVRGRSRRAGLIHG